MEFVIDNVLPVVGTTVVGFALVVLLVAIIMVVGILVRIKDYKEVKSNISELTCDVRKMFSGRSNKKRRIVLLSAVSVVIISALAVSSVVLNSQKEKQLIIISPTERISQDVWQEMLLAWEPVPDTGMYYVSIYPVGKRMYDGIAANSFYVDGDKSGVRLKLGDLVYGTGKYNISVSSDVENTQPGTITIYLVDKQNVPTAPQETSMPEPAASTLPKSNPS